MGGGGGGGTKERGGARWRAKRGEKVGKEKGELKRGWGEQHTHTLTDLKHIFSSPGFATPNQNVNMSWRRRKKRIPTDCRGRMV